jgi:type VI secretion system secreted protein VgrG
MTSVNGSSSADASAAAWAEGTLATAEAYAQAEADAAAAERDAREQAAANGSPPPNDGVDSPSAEQRAQDAFWGNDPNRPANTLPGGASGGTNGGGDARTPVSGQDAADLRAAGYSVVEENGKFYFEAPAENVSVTQQADPGPIVILPGNTGGTSGPDGGAPPSTGPVDAGPPPDAGAPVQDAAPPAKPEGPREINSGLGTATDNILNKSPTLQKEWAALEDKGWKVKFGEAGKGSFADRNGTPPTIVLDPNQRNNPSLLAETFSHEVGHATHNLPPEAGMEGKTHDQYVQQNLDRHLDDEGAANFNNARAKDEIGGNGGPADFGINGVQDAKYQAIYNDYKAGNITEEQAKHQMGQVFADGEHTSTNGQTYRDYYSKQYEDKWKAAHPD